MTLKGRYKILEIEVLGTGASAIVYKGLDTQECRNVAVKLYNEGEMFDTMGNDFQDTVDFFYVLHDKQNNLREAVANFKKTEKVPQRLMRRDYSKDTADSAGILRYKTENFLPLVDVRDCFVRLLDYSKNDKGDAGRDTESQSHYLIFELGEETLSQMFQRFNDDARTLSPDELQDLIWTLICMVWGLHAAGYVHMDIKPRNIMQFDVDGRKRWKLIDLDGAVKSKSKQSLRSLTFTPEYMPPELAQALLASPPSPGGGRSFQLEKIVVSRVMDVWSVGMCAMEAVFLQPILLPFYTEWFAETGNNVKFFEWLSDFENDPIIAEDMKEHIQEIDPDLCNLLEGMLTKNPHNRFSIGQAMAHPWFEPIRDVLLLEEAVKNTGSKGCGVM